MNLMPLGGYYFTVVEEKAPVCLDLSVWMGENKKIHEDIELRGTRWAQTHLDGKGKVTQPSQGGVELTKGGFLEKVNLEKYGQIDLV